MNDDAPGPAHPAHEPLMRRLAAIVLIAGLALAAVIFAMSPPEAAEQGVGPHVATLDNSKLYRHELERMGGKAAVLAAEFDDWFDSLWHGRRLAATVALLSIGLSLLLLLLGRLPSPDD